MYRPIEVLLADDHEIFRDGLNLMFKKNPDINLIGEAGNGEELMKLARKLNPDVIIMDIQMPVMNGIEATKLLTSEMPHIGIIALSIMEDDYQIVEMPVSYTHLRAHETGRNLVCRLLLEKKN